jgi:hypothetical protein
MTAKRSPALTFTASDRTAFTAGIRADDREPGKHLSQPLHPQRRCGRIVDQLLYPLCCPLLHACVQEIVDQPQAVAEAAGAEVEVLDSRRLGEAWVLDRVWERLGIGAAIRRVATRRKIDGDLAERVIFALVAQRALEPGSKLAGTKWVAQRVFIEHLAAFSDDAAYRAMDFLLDALGEVAGEVFTSVAHLLNLDCDIVFVDTTSTYWEVEVADELAETLAGNADDETTSPTESATRTFGHSKDHRGDLPQVVIVLTNRPTG